MSEAARPMAELIEEYRRTKKKADLVRLLVPLVIIGVFVVFIFVIYGRVKAFDVDTFTDQIGEKAVKLPIIYQRSEKDRNTGEERTVRRMGRAAVFCRCQVKPIRGERHLGNCSVCGGEGSFFGGRPCRPCDGTGSVPEGVQR